jgi:uncharacterized membrane protein YbhN (UPF0104 family)
MTDPVSERSGVSLRQAVVTLVAVAVVAVVLVKTGAATHLSLSMLLAGLAIQPLNAMSSLFAGSRIKALSGNAVTRPEAFKAVCLANALMFVLPSRLSDAVKPIFLADRCGLPVLKGLAVIMFERMIDVVIVAIGASFATALIASSGFTSVLPVWIGLALSVCVAAYIMLFRPGAILFILRHLPGETLRRHLVAIFTQVSDAVSPRTIPSAIGWGVLAWLVSWSMFYVFLTIASSVPPTLESSLVAFLAASIGLAAAVAPGGLGTFEAATVAALGLYGYPLPEALALAVGLHLAVLGYQLPLAIWIMGHDGFGLGRIMQKASAYLKLRNLTK